MAIYKALSALAKAANKTREIPIRRGSDGYREYAGEIDALLPEDVLRVFHATDQATAERFLQEGVLAANKPLSTVEGSFSPGRGLNAGLYVGDSPLAVEGYGRDILELRLPKNRLTVPGEAQGLGYATPGLALTNSHTGALVPGDIPAAQITRWGGGPYERPPVLAELAHRAPRDEALALAQYRAALPVEQGGLELPAGNTPMERAAAMGYGGPWYRGDQAGLEAFIAQRAPRNEQAALKGVHMAESPAFAGRYAGATGQVYPLLVRGDYVDGVNPVDVPSHEFDLVKKLLGRGNKPYVSDGQSPPIGNYVDATTPQRAEKILGDYAGLDYEARYGDLVPGGMAVSDKSRSRVAFDPANIRSRFAAFDPFLKDSSDLLAGLAPYALPAGVGALAAGAMAPEEAEAGIAGQLAKPDASPYASMMELKRKQRLANEAQMTHTPRAPLSAGGQAVRALALEAMNPASWPLFGYSRELGRPEDLRLVNGQWLTP